MLLEVMAEASQRTEYFQIVLVIRANFYTVVFRNDKGDFQDIDRIEAQAFSIERGVRIDIRSGYVEIQSGNDQLCQGELLGTWRRGRRLPLCRSFVHGFSG